MYATFSSDGLMPARLPLSLPTTEFKLLFTLAPSAGDPGFGPLTIPFNVGSWEAVASGPSEDRRSLVAGGSAFGLALFCLLLNKNDMLCGGGRVSGWRIDYFVVERCVGEIDNERVRS